MQLYRRKRMQLFLSLVQSLGKPHVGILDLGGRKAFWKETEVWDNPTYSVTLLNQAEGDDIAGPESRLHASNVRAILGDARNLSGVEHEEFDVIFSNSVIEHVGTFDDQRAMASEVRRLGRKFFIQTPNKWFPLEPHFKFPLFPLLPLSARVFLVQHFDMGCFRKAGDRESALRKVQSVRLLTRQEFSRLFPESTIYGEKVLGITKSFVAHNFL